MTIEQLTPEERDYVERCRRFAVEVIGPLHARYDEENAFPAAIHEQAYARELMNAGFPRELGGAGLRLRALAHGGRAMAAVCAPTAFTMGFNHGSLRPVMFAGTSEQKQVFVRDLLARRGYASWCMTERDVSGSNLMAIRTRADRTDAGFVLRGDKCMTGNGAVASLFFVLADAWEGSRRLGPTVFAVPRQAGVEVGANTDKLGFRCLTTTDVSFRDVALDASAVIGAVGEGLAVIVDSLDFMRLGGGIVTLGLVDGALRDLIPWLEEREIYGGLRLVDDSHTQIVFGRLVAEVVALEGLLDRVAVALDEGGSASREASALKLLGADLAMRATAEAMQSHGWRGIDARFPAQKRFRDARQTSIYEGTADILSMNLFRGLVRARREESLATEGES
jgi:alkylation response protein AidB-like acyl-CoA dehydrogenase